MSITNRMQEPGAAVLLDPSIIKAEEDFMFETDPTLHARKLDPEEIDEGDRATLIHAIDEEKFWDLLVRVRSKDWSKFCQEHGKKHQSGPSSHDEL